MGLEDASRASSDNNTGFGNAESLKETATTPDGFSEPAWRRVTLGEPRFLASIAVLLTIGIQLALPSRIANHPQWAPACLAGALLLGIVVANPTRIDRPSGRLRAASLVLIAVLSTANVACVVRLVNDLANSEGIRDATKLLLTGGAIWATNVIIFAIWYWEFDRGGPAARALAQKTRTDLQFPQMASKDPEWHEWEPNFIDNLYTSFSNSTALSSSDVLPLSRWAKLTMMLQAGISLAVVALVIARAVSIFK